MNRTHKKLAILTLSAFIVEAGLILSVATNFGANSFLSLKATSNDYSVTFSKAVSTLESGSYGGTTTISSKLSGGTKVYADISSAYFMSSVNNIARFTGSDSNYIKFYFNGGVTNFSSINSMDFTYSNSNGTFDIYYSSTPIDFNNPSTYSVKSVSDAPASVFLGDSGIHYVAIHSKSGAYAYFASVKINYTCGGDPEPGKTLSSISVSGQTTEFDVGDTFDFGGTVTAHYDDSSTEDVTASATFSGYDMSSVGNQTVTVSYGGKSTTYSITVSSPAGGLSGSYVNSFTQATLEFTSSTSGTYSYYEHSCDFSYVLNGTSITFTYVSGDDNTDFGNYRLFDGGSSPVPNSTAVLNNGTSISLSIYNNFGPSKPREFTKS